jgi:hypothetical protein
MVESSVIDVVHNTFNEGDCGPQGYGEVAHLQLESGDQGGPPARGQGEDQPVCRPQPAAPVGREY